MGVNETIAEFNGRLRDIASPTYQLGKKYLEVRLERKTLRSLPERFSLKVAAIQKAKNVDILCLHELMTSLQTYEMNLNVSKKEKELAYKEKKSAIKVMMIVATTMMI